MANDTSNKTNNDSITTTIHSPLFQKIIQSRVEAGFTSSLVSTLTPSELQAVETLQSADPGTIVTVGSGDEQEVFVKG